MGASEMVNLWQFWVELVFRTIFMNLIQNRYDTAVSRRREKIKDRERLLVKDVLSS